MDGQKIPDWNFFRFSILFPIGLFGMGQLLEGGMGKQNGREVGGRRSANKQAGPVPPPRIQILAGAMPRKNRSDAQG